MIWQPVGYQQLTAAASSTALTVPDGAVRAIINVEVQPARWRDDGVAPTAAIGILVPVAGKFEYRGDLSAIRFFQTAPSTQINVSYYAPGGG